MTKKWKITFWGLIVIDIILCIVGIMCGRYESAFYMFINAVWCFVYLRIMEGWLISSDLNDTLIKEYSDLQRVLHDSKEREKIAISEYQKARKELEKYRKA